MSLLLAIQGWEVESWRDSFRRRLPGRDVVVAGEPYDREAVRYACAWSPPAGVIEELPGLEAVFCLGAGVDALLALPELPDVPLVRVVDTSLTDQMTEWVVLQVLMQHRRQLDYLASQRAHVWKPIPHPPASLVQVGIMGMGELGTHAAAALRALGYPVAGWSRTKKDVAGVETFAGEAGLEAFLARTDILVCLLPLTPETEGLVDFALLSRLRRDNALGGAFFVNAGRGRIQVEADIVRALREDVLAGCSLDVFATEPLPEDSPLWDEPRVAITPHVAADSRPDAIASYIAGQIARHERGEPFANVVDRGRGY